MYIIYRWTDEIDYTRNDALVSGMVCIRRKAEPYTWREI